MNQSPQRSLLWKYLQVLARSARRSCSICKCSARKMFPKPAAFCCWRTIKVISIPFWLPCDCTARSASWPSLNYLRAAQFFRWLIRSLHAFPVKQNSADVGAIKQAIAKLQEGNVLNIYPEGSRTQNGEIGAILPGVALVLKRANVPIVPVVIDGSFQAWPHGQKIFRKHPIRVLYGEPMDMDGLKGSEIVTLVDRTLRRMLVELRKK